MQAPVIYVIAGVNGSGKSSVVGPYFNLDGLEIYNPDEEEKALRSRFPDKSKIEVNEIAWREGIRRLREAIKSNTRYAFETTLGGANTIPSLLIEAANKGHLVRVSYVGLESVELNLRRVRERVLKGGHAIPESKIRERWDNSRANLIRLLPYLDSLRLFDNSHEADPQSGFVPQPRLLLDIRGKKLMGPEALSRKPPLLDQTPDWAVPIVRAAVGMKLF